MRDAIRLALALDLILLVIEYLVPVTHKVLPLGGNTLMQIGILVILAIAFSEVTELLHKP